MDRKLVKEITGHRSDAVDAYQVTSDEQRKMCSNIIQGQKELKVQLNSPNRVRNESEVDDKTEQLRANASKGPKICGKCQRK